MLNLGWEHTQDLRNHTEKYYHKVKTSKRAALSSVSVWIANIEQFVDSLLISSIKAN